nr:unnamed protein product [Callosobruchus analis]
MADNCWKSECYFEM